jgi:hypothetical protein
VPLWSKLRARGGSHHFLYFIRDKDMAMIVLRVRTLEHRVRRQKSCATLSGESVPMMAEAQGLVHTA